MLVATLGLAAAVLALLPHTSSTGPTQSAPQARPAEVRRALPVALRALPIDAAAPENPPISYAASKRIIMPDGSIVQTYFQGKLPNAASLPPLGRFNGEAWVTADGTTWIWATPAGAAFPSWVDP